MRDENGEKYIGVAVKSDCRIVGGSRTRARFDGCSVDVTEMDIPVPSDDEMDDHDDDDENDEDDDDNGGDDDEAPAAPVVSPSDDDDDVVGVAGAAVRVASAVSIL